MKVVSISAALAAALVVGCAEQPATAPAGTRAAMSAQPVGPRESLTFYSARDGGSTLHIYLMNPDGNDPVALSSGAWKDQWPDISPNGRDVVFTSNRDGGTHIFRMSTAGGDPVDLTYAAGALDDWARWSPNGHEIAFQSKRDGAAYYHIYVMDLRDASITQVTDCECASDDMWPEWSPNGTKLSFRRGSNSAGHVYVLNLADGSETDMTPGAAALNQMAPWSQNGTMIAFMSNRDGYPAVYVMNADGSNQVNLTPKAAADLASAWLSRAPAWTRDGRILFMSKRPSTGGDLELFSMTADGGNLVRLTTSAGEDGGPRVR